MLTGNSVSSEHETEVKGQVTRPQCDEGRRMDVYQCLKSKYENGKHVKESTDSEATQQ